ncbi:hypothetical protein ACFSKU_00305 [Pontibacter silvestris]|uniref:Uncharacterized protein n=1 Tax=Pontibacter silvestris TaxID=2305183 RepID=A0ABW4WSY4_9BACT|nr:hypothetical protein [Pontibacter silvestris]MCC9138195.1 hypothetical protein [Pontibacter silvestris]
MTKGHNKGEDKLSRPEAENRQEKDNGQNRHLSDQQKKKGPQGRHPNEDPSGGTKGSNAI